MQTSFCNDILRPIHYLGSKLRILDMIKDVVDEVEPMRGTLCDMFSGSGTVSNYFANYRDVISVDIQEYSRVLCAALLMPAEAYVDECRFVESIKASESYKQLVDVFGGVLEFEERSQKLAAIGNIENIYNIIENGSIIIAENTTEHDALDELQRSLRESIRMLVEKGLASKPIAMVTRYFGGLYFAYKQAVQIDATLEYIYNITKDGTRIRDMLVASVLSATSEIVNTVGKQFAQPLRVKNADGTYKMNLRDKVMNDRGESFFEKFQYWICKYRDNSHVMTNHSVIKSDYRDALEMLKGRNVSVVYADPPYSRYHYSRYYHVLETISLRDMPVISSTFEAGDNISRGIYRKDRHQSPFSIKSEATSAFNALFKGIYEIGAPLVLSYSPHPENPVTPRMQSIDQIVAIGERYYSTVKVIQLSSISHSKLNNSDKNYSKDYESELIITCK